MRSTKCAWFCGAVIAATALLPAMFAQQAAIKAKPAGVVDGRSKQ
jgi:hypothetical protein